MPPPRMRPRFDVPCACSGSIPARWSGASHRALSGRIRTVSGPASNDDGTVDRCAERSRRAGWAKARRDGSIQPCHCRRCHSGRVQDGNQWLQRPLRGGEALGPRLPGHRPGAGNRLATVYLSDSFRCSDGDLMIIVGNDGQFRSFCAAPGMPELAADARFARNTDRLRHADALAGLIAGALRERSMVEYQALFDAAGIPASSIDTLAQVFADPQVAAHRMVRPVAQPVGGTVRVIANPMPSPQRAGAVAADPGRAQGRERGATATALPSHWLGRRVNRLRDRRPRRPPARAAPGADAACPASARPCRPCRSPDWRRRRRKPGGRRRPPPRSGGSPR